MPDAEIVFQVREAPEGGYTARAVSYSIFTQGDDWEDLKFMLRDAVLCHFDDGEAPKMIRIDATQGDGTQILGHIDGRSVSCLKSGMQFG